jgi:hypothetical protein
MTGSRFWRRSEFCLLNVAALGRLATTFLEGLRAVDLGASDSHCDCSPDVASSRANQYLIRDNIPLDSALCGPGD